MGEGELQDPVAFGFIEVGLGFTGIDELFPRSEDVGGEAVGEETKRAVAEAV